MEIRYVAESFFSRSALQRRRGPAVPDATHIHALFESEFVGANVRIGDLEPLVKAEQPKFLNDVFDDYVAYLQHSNTFVEKTYQLEKAGAFTGEGTPEGKRFAVERLAAAATELRNMIYTAWIRSGDAVPAHESSTPAGGSPASSSR